MKRNLNIPMKGNQKLHLSFSKTFYVNGCLRNIKRSNPPKVCLLSLNFRKTASHSPNLCTFVTCAVVH